MWTLKTLSWLWCTAVTQLNQKSIKYSFLQFIKCLYVIILPDCIMSIAIVADVYIHVAGKSVSLIPTLAK